MNTFKNTSLKPASPHPSGPDSFSGLHASQAAELQTASLSAVLHVHLQRQTWLNAQEHLPPRAAAVPLPLCIVFLSVR